MRKLFLRLFTVLAMAAPAAYAETLIVAGGCFWCVEADFEKVKGVSDARSGFTGGTVANPTYKQVTRGGTGHYEAVEITFDPSMVSRNQLLSLFIRSVDPTDPNGQFCDRGQSYATAIFVGGPKERSEAEQILKDAESQLGQRIATKVLPEAPFYAADDKHQDYYKGTGRVLTRFGIKRQSEAYKAYREACGRDARVRELWGNQAPFVDG